MLCFGALVVTLLTRSILSVSVTIQENSYLIPGSNVAESLVKQSGSYWITLPVPSDIEPEDVEVAVQGSKIFVRNLPSHRWERSWNFDGYIDLSRLSAHLEDGVGTVVHISFPVPKSSPLIRIPLVLSASSSSVEKPQRNNHSHNPPLHLNTKPLPSTAIPMPPPPPPSIQQRLITAPPINDVDSIDDGDYYYRSNDDSILHDDEITYYSNDNEHSILTIDMLNTFSAEMQQDILHEPILKHIEPLYPRLAMKMTGIILSQLDSEEILGLLNDENMMQLKLRDIFNNLKETGFIKSKQYHRKKINRGHPREMKQRNDDIPIQSREDAFIRDKMKHRLRKEDLERDRRSALESLSVEDLLIGLNLLLNRET